MCRPPTMPLLRRQRFTLNVTRADMIARRLVSPSVRLFEAAACGTPIISDAWEGLTVLVPGREILIADARRGRLNLLRGSRRPSAAARRGRRRARVLADHSAAPARRELEAHPPRAARPSAACHLAHQCLASHQPVEVMSTYARTRQIHDGRARPERCWLQAAPALSARICATPCLPTARA